MLGEAHTVLQIQQFCSHFDFSWNRQHTEILKSVDLHFNLFCFTSQRKNLNRKNLKFYTVAQLNIIYNDNIHGYNSCLTWGKSYVCFYCRKQIFALDVESSCFHALFTSKGSGITCINVPSPLFSAFFSNTVWKN